MEVLPARKDRVDNTFYLLNNEIRFWNGRKLLCEHKKRVCEICRPEQYKRFQEQKRQYYQENADRIKEQQRQWNQENADRLREWRKENADRVREWRKENADILRERSTMERRKCR